MKLVSLTEEQNELVEAAEANETKAREIFLGRYCSPHIDHAIAMLERDPYSAERFSRIRDEETKKGIIAMKARGLSAHYVWNFLTGASDNYFETLVKETKSSCFPKDVAIKYLKAKISGYRADALRQEMFALLLGIFPVNKESGKKANEDLSNAKEERRRADELEEALEVAAKDPSYFALAELVLSTKPFIPDETKGKILDSVARLHK